MLYEHEAPAFLGRRAVVGAIVVNEIFLELRDHQPVPRLSKEGRVTSPSDGVCHTWMSSMLCAGDRRVRSADDITDFASSCADRPWTRRPQQAPPFVQGSSAHSVIYVDCGMIGLFGRGVAQPGSAPALGERDPGPTLPFHYIDSLCFPTWGICFRSVDYPS
jgi:hypothetical protein